MEFSMLFIASFLFLFMLLKLVMKPKSGDVNSKKLPPGPCKLPIIGNLHQIIGSLPHRSFRNLSNKYGPLMLLQLGQIPTIIVSSAEIAKEVMNTHDTIFASRPRYIALKILSYDFTDIAFAPYGNYWRQLRKICTLELLSTKRVQSFRGIREEETLNLVKWIASQAGCPVNLTKKIQSLACGITGRTAFGNKYKDQDKFLSNISESSKIASGFNVAEVFPSLSFLHGGTMAKLERLHGEADKFVEDIIEDHKKKRKDGKGDEVEDLVDVLLNKQEQDGHEFQITSNNIKAVILDVFGGASETAASTVAWAMAELIKHPEVMKRAQLELREIFDETGLVDEIKIPKYLKLIIKETLRLHPPLPMLLPRECGEGCVINGYGIPPKARVLVNAWAICREPKYWKNPEEFQPERFIYSPIDYKGNHYEYIPFGAGKRVCPGMSFGLANMELELAMLLYYFDWKLPGGMMHEDLDMSEDFGISMRRRDDLLLIPLPYHHQHAI